MTGCHSQGVPVNVFVEELVMRGLKLYAIAVIATLALSSCQRPTELLPPAPQFDASDATETVSTPLVNDATGSVDRDGVAPGSVEDFLRYAGSDKVYFAYDSAELTPEANAVLDRQAEWLKKYPAVRASLEGHADERGTKEYNFGLGERRAAVMKFYMMVRGLPAERLSTTSFGKERPSVSGSDEASWHLNRRGETILIGAMGQK